MQSGTIAYAMGATDCLMYQPGTKLQCRASAEGLFVGYDTMGNVLTHSYLPWYWPEGITLTQDMVALTSQVYTNCSMDKLLTTLTHIPTVEGGTAMLGRVSSALFYEYADWQEEEKNPFATDTTKGFALGRTISAVFKWYI